MLDRLAADFAFRWQAVDVDADPALASRFGARVPVIALGDHEVAQAPIDEGGLRTAMARALSGTPASPDRRR